MTKKDNKDEKGQKKTKKKIKRVKRVLGCNYDSPFGVTMNIPGGSNYDEKGRKTQKDEKR